MAKIIIGLSGQIASGKEVVKKHLEKCCGGVSFKFSDVLRKILKDLDVPAERDNIIRLSTFLRQAYGEDLLARALTKQVSEANNDLIIVDGIRRLADIEYLKHLDNFYLIAIEAKLELRYQRALSRAENPGDAKKSWEEFLADEAKETEVTIPAVMAQANYTLENNGTLEELKEQIDKTLTLIQNKQKEEN
ncbi:MAG: AAA family ATPase [Patescibacteria group bacterium]|nr:AAA family ATPase [Patescibacteria group bacterium]